MTDKKIEGILFDLGDTLLDFGKVDVQGLFEIGARLSYAFLRTEGLKLPAFSRYHRKQLWAIRWQYFKSHFTRKEFNALDLIHKLGRRMGHRLSEKQVEKLAELWYQPLKKSATVEDGLGEMLRGFREQGLKLGVISNTFVPGEALDKHLEEEGLLEYLPDRIYSCDVRYRKPNRNIFRLALEKTQLRPEATMFVGDSPRADIVGANRIGMISVLKDPTGRYDDNSISPRHRIRSALELQDIVDLYRTPAQSDETE